MAFSTSKRTRSVGTRVTETVWTLADTAGVGDAEQLADAVSISVQVTGTFDSGSVTIKASNDGVNFVALSGSLSAAGITTVAADSLGYRHYRPELSGGGASSALVVTAIAVRR